MAYPGLRADYPQVTTTSEGCIRTYVYRAEDAALPLISYGIIYLGHPVQTATKTAVDLTDLADLTIVTLQKTPPLDEDGNIVDTPEGEEGDVYVAPPILVGAPSEVVDNQYPFYEVDWIQLEKSLRHHPAFAGFTDGDWNAIDAWTKEPETATRALFKYWERDADGGKSGTVKILSTDNKPDKSPKVFAQLQLLGVDSFLDFAPVARKTQRYRGKNAPAIGDAGQKSGGDPFDAVPAGYSWLKTADRASKQGTGSEWIQQQEWTGARLVLVDKDEIFFPIS